MVKGTVKKQKKTLKPVTKFITINLSKLTHKVCYKRKAPRAIKEIRSIAGKLMHTKVLNFFYYILYIFKNLIYMEYVVYEYNPTLIIYIFILIMN
ncbi:hypothetical protein PFMALIP_00952 [Plasmodium falciparum MaliPS096_E11]|uniref:Uncharacterized protein n=1 Tax=Plasmodium falciparum MaliPS096_E11 TaxID=1036727 RepID=A0A024WUU3_PLAFA|nr:hypothetical protein PFMALIP_00952 [Plasmodium falciparum MaliPS096_E11]